MAVFRLWPLRILLVGARAGLCDGAIRRRHSKWGGADFIVADPNYVAHLPVGLTSRDAAPLICAGITSYKGLKKTQTKPGQWVVVFSVGGLGHLAVQCAKAMGLLVCAVDVDDGKARARKTLRR